MKYSNKLVISNFKFGIELEMEGDYTYFRNKVKLLDGWIVKNEHCGTEVVSPPLTGYVGLLIVRRQLRNIWAKYKKIKFYDAGLHVHVDIQHFNLGQAKRLIIFCNRFDNAIFSLMEGSRWRNNFCRRLNYNEDSIVKSSTLYDLQSLQSGERYSACNLYAFPKYGTVEFRYAGGTCNWQKIYALISLYLRIVAFAASSLEMPDAELDIKVDSEDLIYPRKILAAFDIGKNRMFNALQISGGVREILDDMFERNVLSLTDSLADKTENRVILKGLRKQCVESSE